MHGQAGVARSWITHPQSLCARENGQTRQELRIEGSQKNKVGSFRVKQCNLRYEFSNKRSTSKSTEENQVSSPPQNAPRFEIFGAKRPIPAPAVYRPGNISATDTSFRSRRDSAFFRADRHPTSAQTTMQETAAGLPHFCEQPTAGTLFRTVCQHTKALRQSGNAPASSGSPKKE